MPEPKERSTSAALETARGWSARERERAASAPNRESSCERMNRLYQLWCNAISSTREPRDLSTPESHVEALIAFGCAAHEAGLKPRADALDMGSDEFRPVAVEFVQLVLSGDQAVLAPLTQALRDTAQGRTALAIAHDIVLYEMLEIVRPVRVPLHWEGHPPEREVRTVEDLIAWFDQQLATHFLVSIIPTWSDDGAVLRNARRLMDELHIDCDAPRAVGQLSSVEVENQLRDLKAICQRVQNAQAAAEKIGESTAPGTPGSERGVAALFGIYTNGLANARFAEAVSLVANGTLTTNQKLAQLDELIPIPSGASADLLAQAFGVSRQAVMQTDWWGRKRKGTQDEEAARRGAKYKRRGSDLCADEPDNK